VWNNIDRLQNTNAYRTMSDRLMKQMKMLVKHQKVKMPLNIMAHMQEKPRLLLGCNNLSMLAKMMKATNAKDFRRYVGAIRTDGN